MINFYYFSNKISLKTVVKIMFIFTFFLFGSAKQLNGENEINPEILKLKAPETFKAKFETTKGDFEVTAERKLSPLAADRFYQLIKSGYFTDIPIYRVMQNFVAQFGTVDDALDSAWSKHIIIDEPVQKSNDTGTVAFARAGKNTRGTQLFINLRNNSRLDTVTYGETTGFVVFAYISKGMETVFSFYNGYGDAPRLKIDSITGDIGEYYKANYPNMDYIKKAYIIDSK